MLNSAPVSVQAKGQVTLPRAVREKLKLKKGDLVTFVETSEGIVIKPAALVPNEALDEIGQALQAQGITLSDLLERGGEIREQLARAKYGLAANNPGYPVEQQVVKGFRAFRKRRP